MSDKIDEILRQRQAADKPQAETETLRDDKFFSILKGEGMMEKFLELQFKTGMQTCFNYENLQWFNHDPETGSLDLAFGSFLITIKGRGLKPLFAGVKSQKVAWVREANDELQDHKQNESFIESIVVTPPPDFTEDDTSEN